MFRGNESSRLVEWARLFVRGLRLWNGADGEVGDAEISVRQKLAADTVNYFLSKVVPGAMGLLFVVTFVRLAGYEQYGRYALVFAVVMASASGMSGWLAQGVLRFQSACVSPGEMAAFYRGLGLGVLLSVGIGVVSLGIAMWFLGVQGGWSVLISLGLFAVLLTYTVLLAQFQAGLRSKAVMKVEALRAISTFAFPLALVWWVGLRQYWALLAGLLLGYAVAVAACLLSGPRSGRLFGRTWRPAIGESEKRVLRRLWGYGWPVALWLLCQGGLIVPDRYFIQRHWGYADAGVYASMYDTVVRSFSLLFMPITLAVHPLVMNRWNAGRRKLALSVLWTAAKCELLLFVPIGLALYLCSPWIARMVLGRGNAGAAGIVVPLAIGGFLWQIALLAHKPLEMLCRTRRMLLGIGLALGVNVAGNHWLVPMFGFTAAAYVAVGSSTTYLISLAILTPIGHLREQVAAGVSAAPLGPGLEDLGTG